ncbi:AAA family ATPase [Mycolicibacterium sp.]|uniref:AAA family ATPase n=1 Tax=Mycolicibacterium sp. TaxID=2320850 RepID=UPI00093D1DFA|nr:AAA family ATPase [Mycobacterium sp. DSM 3803]OKH77716.1 aminobenzoate synthetase [Mycobacterium sp. SWH-M3]
MTHAHILDQVAALAAADTATVLIDGRSGAGKSALADDLASRLPATTIVRLDDIYPGWDGLAWAVEHVHTELLQPRAAGRPGRWRRWNWTTGTPDGWGTVEPGHRLIVEGVGALSAANRALADVGIWIDAPDDLRKQRALERDGDTYRPHWDRWAAQEEVFIARYAPRSAADYIVTQFVPNSCTISVQGTSTT